MTAELLPMRLPFKGRERSGTYRQFTGAAPELHDVERALAAHTVKTTRSVVHLSDGSEPAKSNIKSLEEQLFDTLAFCKITTRQFAMHFDAGWHTKFFKQLDALLDIQEWDPDDKPVTPTSFATLLRLLLILRDKRRPSLGIANGGNIVAAWSNGLHDRLTIECTQNDRVRWLVSVPIDNGLESAAGETSLDRLIPNLQPFSPTHWFDDERSKRT